MNQKFMSQHTKEKRRTKGKSNPFVSHCFIQEFESSLFSGSWLVHYLKRKIIYWGPCKNMNTHQERQ